MIEFNFNVNVKVDASPAVIKILSSLTTSSNKGEVKSSEKPYLVTDGSMSFVPFSKDPVQTAPSDKESGKTSEITDEHLRMFVGPKAKEHGKEKIHEILNGFGVSRVPDLKQDQRQLFIDKLNAL